MNTRPLGPWASSADDDLPVPDERTYVRICVGQFRDEIGTFLLATLLAASIASPWLLAVALGAEPLVPPLCALFGAPAWAGLVAVAAGVARGDATSAWRVGGGARRLASRAVPLGAATAGFAWAFEQSARTAGEVGGAATPLLAAAGAAALAMLAIDLHAFPILALYDAPLRAAARSALGLAAAAPGATVGLLGAGALAFVALAWLGPGTLLVTAPSLAVLTVNNTRMQVARLRTIQE